MDEADQQVRFEAGGRLVCCVCDTRRFSQSPNYFCSNNCEKLFLVLQGLVLGNVLQSVFRDLCEARCSDNKTDTSSRYLDVDIANEWSNKQPGDDIDSVDRNSIPELKHYERVESGAETRDAVVFMSPDPSCNTLASDPESESESNDSDACETAVTVPTNTVKLKTDTGVTTRSQYQASGKTCSGIHRKSNLIQKTEKIQKQPLKLRSTTSSSKVNLNASKKYAAVSDLKSQTTTICEELDQGNVQIMNSDKPEKRRIKCKRCSKLISTSYLYVHYRAMHKDNLKDISVASLSCSECGKLFMRKQALNAHKLKRHNYKFTNHCNHCGKGFASRFGLSWHMRQVHKVTIRQCGTCGETFENRRDYKKHRRYQHAANSHVCHICGKGFKLKNALQAHLDAHAGVKLHFCEICGDGFVRFSSLCQHKNNLHGPKKSELPFKCHLCPNTFRLQAWLDKHIVQKHHSVHGQGKADCELCQDYLKTSVQCPLHGDTPREEAFSCPQCNKVFAKDSNLKAHMKQHQEPKFSCDVCQKKFTYKCNMLRHRDTHNSEKPFHCDTCAKQFCTKFLLASHMRMHNQDLLFKCEICGKGLTRKDYLKNHLKKMHPDHVQHV